jgi:uncharacterized surface protein with fasciclin (FAS1) repeats
MTVPKILFVAIALLCGSSMMPVEHVNGEEQESATSATSTSATTCTSITDIVCDEEYSNEYNLKAICEAISISELDDDLNEESWTLFAPNDNAFESLGRNNLDYLVFNATIDSVPLTDLLLFHIIPGVGLTSAELPCVAGNNLIEMANGEDSRTLCTMKTIPFSQKGQYNSKITPPLIIKANIQACNGIVSNCKRFFFFCFFLFSFFLYMCVEMLLKCCSRTRKLHSNSNSNTNIHHLSSFPASFPFRFFRFLHTVHENYS